MCTALYSKSANSAASTADFVRCYIGVSKTFSERMQQKGIIRRGIQIAQLPDIYTWQFHFERSAAYKSAMDLVI